MAKIFRFKKWLNYLADHKPNLFGPLCFFGFVLFEWLVIYVVVSIIEKFA